MVRTSSPWVLLSRRSCFLTDGLPARGWWAAARQAKNSKINRKANRWINRNTGGRNASPLACVAVAALTAGVALVSMPSAVVAAELTVRELTETFFKAQPGERVDFSGRNLGALDLSGLDFKRAKLARVNLSGADLTTANLSGTDLAGATLDRATLIRADFTGADLSGATILRPTIFATLDNNQLDAPRFRQANLSGIRIVASRLDGADFREANLTGAILGPQEYVWGEGRRSQRAVLLSCDFSGATMTGANLVNAVLQFARFRNANLAGIKLSDTDLTKADFSGADLTGADLTGADVDGADLRGVRGLATVVGLSTIQNLDKAIR